MNKSDIIASIQALENQLRINAVKHEVESIYSRDANFREHQRMIEQKIEILEDKLMKLDCDTAKERLMRNQARASPARKDREFLLWRGNFND